jgi:tetratricopeptide (TPR) repeat protein
MTFEQPPRLRDSEHLGPLLRAAEPTVTAERLAVNAAGVKARLAAGATTFAAWKLIVPLVLLLGVLVPVLIQATRERAAGERSAGEASIVAIAPDAGADAAVADAATLEDVVDAAEVELVSDAAPEPRRRSVPRTVVADAGVDAAPEAAPSDLPEQIRIYEAARAAGRRGDLAGGLELLAELVRRFPATPLRAEAELTRAELWARADRVEAVPALEALIADPVHRGRRGELLRTLGDLHRRRGDCPHALEAYDRALAERLGRRDRSDVERGRARCVANPARR